MAVLRLLPRGYRFARRVVRAALQGAYAKLVILPYLRRHAKLGRAWVSTPAFDGVAIHDGKTFYKIALSAESTIEREYRNWEETRRQYPALTIALPDYRRNARGMIRYLSMPYYRPLDADACLGHARNVFALMRTCSTPKQRLRLSESRELAVGLNVIGRVYDETVRSGIQDAIRSYIEGGRYHTGFTHGDFHPRNLLLDDRGKPRLVDLDCVRIDGIQELDALTFVLELEWSRSGALWHQSIGSYFRGDIPGKAREILEGFGVEFSQGLGITYLVDRVGQETEKYGVRYGSAQLDPAIEEILREPLDHSFPTRARTT